MLKKCLSLFITGMILIAIGGIGIATLAINGINLNGISIGPSSAANKVNASDAVTIEETEEITSLDFSANAGIFTVVRGENFGIATNADTVNYELTDGCLKIANTTSTSFMSFEDVAVEIIVTIPERSFKEVKFSLNAGEFYADDIIADKFTFDMNAGEAVLNNISAITTADISINMGECTFNNSELSNSKINMDAGEMTFEECKLTGENNINLDLGEVSITLLGKRSDYKLDIENDFGEVNVKGDETSDNISPIGTIKFNLDLGELNIDFTEE